MSEALRLLPPGATSAVSTRSSEEETYKCLTHVCKLSPWYCRSTTGNIISSWIRRKMMGKFLTGKCAPSSICHSSHLLCSELRWPAHLTYLALSSLSGKRLPLDLHSSKAKLKEDPKTCTQLNSPKNDVFSWLGHRFVIPSHLHGLHICKRTQRKGLVKVWAHSLYIWCPETSILI